MTDNKTPDDDELSELEKLARSWPFPDWSKPRPPLPQVARKTAPDFLDDAPF